MQFLLEKIEMGTQLKIPTGFGLIGYGFVNTAIVLGGVGNVVVSLHGVLPMVIQFCLKYVTKHLDVETSRPVTLAHHGVDIAASVVQRITQGEFWQ